MSYGQVTSSPVVIPAPKPGATITLIPGSGNTSLCEFSTTETAINNPSGAIWQSWSWGTISSTTSDVLNGKVVALRFTRVSGSSTDNYEVVG